MTQTTNSTCMFKEGDFVIVKDNGKSYTSYVTLAKILKLETYSGISGDSPTEGVMYMVVRTPDPFESAILAIQSLHTEQEFLIHTEGVTKI